jgi:hypothetical protein
MTAINFAATPIITPGFKAFWGLQTYVFTRQTTDLDSTFKADKLDGSTWGARFKNDLPGLQEATTKITGKHSAIRNQIGDILPNYVGQTTPIYAWNALESLNVLAPVGFGPVSVMEYSPKAKEKDVTTFDTELSARGAAYSGFILVSPNSTTQLATTGTGSDDDSTLSSGATAFGGVIQMHVYDISGGTTPTMTMIVQHSTDGTTWSTLASFVVATPLTIPTTYVQNVLIPSTTTVNAHVRASWTTTGAPTSVQALVMYDRLTDPSL